MAWLGSRDFARARNFACYFELWSNYREFMQERDALFVGYGEAGVTARIQRVPFEDFERWSRLTGVGLDIAALDDFAAHWRFRLENPHARISGEIVELRASGEQQVQVNGVQIVPVHPDLFAQWRIALTQLGLFDRPPALSDYAALVIETCIGSRRRRRFA